MARLRISVVVALLFVIAPVGVAAHASTSSGAAHVAVIAASDTTIPDEAITDSTAVWRVENDPSACINSNPRPNCGYKPTDAGERGGALQISLFFIMLGAFTFYFVAVLIIRIRSELLAIKLRNARMGEVAMRQVPAE